MSLKGEKELDGGAVVKDCCYAITTALRKSGEKAGMRT
jgi:hypothetical protein